MILSKLKIGEYTNNLGKIVKTQTCNVKCDNCEIIYKSKYYNIVKNRKKYNNKDLCLSCKQKEQYKNGLRNKQKEFISSYATKFQKGKTFEEMYGNDKAEQVKKKLSLLSSGENNSNYGGKYSHGFAEDYLNRKGKTFEELYGEDKAKQLKEEFSVRSKGSNNPMYGKPSPMGSGNGWSGWYKGWYFRSLIELSYMINVIEKNNYTWENAEKKKYKISYLKEGRERNYFGDFIINDKEYIEIKPLALRNSELVLLKEKAAIKWCKEHNLIYRIVCNDEFDRLSNDEIKSLHDIGDVKFMNRYEEKYKEKYS